MYKTPNSILSSYFPFPILIMPCERIDWEECLTVMALKNDVPGVNQFLSNVDKSKPFDPTVIIISDALATLVIEGWLRPKDYGQVKAYLVTD